MPPSPLYDPSPQALAILTGTFWSAQGWRRPAAWPDPGGMRVAVDAGVMFAAGRTHDHDGWVAAARAAVARVTAAEVGEAFLASLTSRRLDLRSALGSYAVARHLPEHAADREPGGYRCLVCGLHLPADEEPENLNVFSFERFKWGGVRTDKVPYLAFDLEQFTRAPRLAPGPAEIELGQRLIDQLRQLPAALTAARAVPQLTMIKGNKSEREVLVGILGVCGILQTAEHPGYADRFIPLRDRHFPSHGTDQHYPARWWTAADGVSTAALRTFLPQLA